ncbi:AAA family ATPase [Streptomyces zingiberis]|uniref:AAA family ATPase n=1 Tax=Streptomyces zingiberis TaxID=2053010 RepID=A0ABX1C8H4_9ACTN|nr:AAA family ATPase [Streptomyces zingiberis]NJQ03244.1 AAA family ATPase [Streptomyces zingiberis]
MPTLVGRAPLLAAVEARVAAGGSAVLTGPSGIGKSSLLEAVGSAAAGRGELVLRAAGTATERWIPYAVLAELLSQVPPDWLDALPGPQRAAMDGVLLRDRPAVSGGRAQFACRLAWQTLLARCAQAGPVLLLLDDAQWLDTASADTLAYGARRLAGGAVRTVLAGQRPEEGAGLAAPGAGPGAGPAAPPRGRPAPWPVPPGSVEIAVPPLAPDELADLLDQYGLPARVANTLHAESGGNPYLALALGGAFTGRLPRHGRPVPLPRHVHALIGDRVAALPTRTRETLLVAALATRPTADLLLRAGRADADQDIRRAEEAGLLVTEGGALRFTPPAVGTVLAESASAAHRAATHTVLAGAVTDTAGRVRHRALASADPDAEVARSLVTAAEAARRQGSHRLAAELYLLAADRTPCEFEAERLEWLVVAAEVGAAAGLPGVVHRAADAVLAADTHRGRRVRVRVALIDLSGQALAERDEVFAAALVDAGDDPLLLAPLRLRLSWAAMVDGRPGPGGAEAARAAALARAAGDTDTEAMALCIQAIAARVRGRADHRALMAAALALPQPAVDGRLHMAPRFHAARFAVFDDRLAEARQDLLRMLALTERGQGEEVMEVLRSLSEVSARLGRCADALDFADRAIRIAEDAALSPGPVWYSAAVAELAGGAVQRAVAYAERGVRASEQERDSIYLGRHLHVLGQARLRTGDVRRAVEALLRIRELEREQGVSAPLVLRWHGDLAAGLTSLGRHDEAAGILAAAREAIARELGGAPDGTGSPGPSPAGVPAPGSPAPGAPAAGVPTPEASLPGASLPGTSLPGVPSPGALHPGPSPSGAAPAGAPPESLPPGDAWPVVPGAAPPGTAPPGTASRGGLPPGAGALAGLDRAEAALLAARGDPDAAAALLDSAARRFAALGQPLEHGHCLLVRAGLERRRRRTAAARTAAGEALALFGRHGAKPWAEQAARLLARIDGTSAAPSRTGAAAPATTGQTSPGAPAGPTRPAAPPGAAAAVPGHAGAGTTAREPSPGPGGAAPGGLAGVLTDAEERIAVLVGEGATNQEVAARMFLSVKTIEASLTRIYRKLGLRSRTQLSSWLSSAYGLSDGP